MVLHEVDDPGSNRRPTRAQARDQVHLQFTEQARHAPDALAVECGDEAYTYGELDQLSDALAVVLRRAGVAVEDRVAVCVEPSLGLTAHCHRLGTSFRLKATRERRLNYSIRAKKR